IMRLPRHEAEMPHGVKRVSKPFFALARARGRPSVEDILGRSLRILVLLREAEPEALSLGEIMKGIGMDHRAVTPSIKGLVEWGFVVVEKEKVGQRPVPIHLHKLTRAGREV